MEKIKGFLFSMPLTGALLLLFAFSSGFATFVENDYGTEAAKALVYHSRWFEALLLLLVINLAGSIFRYRMISMKKWSILLFHVSFIIIFIGAGVTRYIGHEGMMRIREGEKTNKMVSDATYISVWATSGESTVYYEKKVLFSPAAKNGFRKSLNVNGQRVELNMKRYIPSATEKIVEAPEGNRYLSMVVSDSLSGMRSFFVKDGEQKKSGGLTFSFNDTLTANAIHIISEGEGLFFKAPDTVNVVSMMGGGGMQLSPDRRHPFSEKTLYRLGSVSFVLKKYLASAVSEWVAGTDTEGMASPDALEISISSGAEAKKAFVFGGKGYTYKPAETETGNVMLRISYGSKPVELPFYIELRDFQIDRYPGSNSPSSYASEVTVFDDKAGLEMPYRIFMNNVLNYKGYRFFQSSYDKDEKGTILSVNHDAWGTLITYAGYFLMTLGMVVSLFSRNGRYSVLSRAMKKLHEKKESFAIIAVFVFFPAFFSGSSAFALPDDGSSGGIVVDAGHASAFGELLMQDRDGRIKPVNTLASEVLRKVSRKNIYNGLSPEQVLLGMMADPEKWQKEAMIRVSNPELASFLGIKG
ncbi:MAG: cytochrome c biogenesis protein ResB, partial [Bacteroidales bacterium]|nr:cytochrome c biogenesis protein ResB [Bacteroidales bacterium]